MNYKIIQPPFEFRFKERDKRELAAYRTWFLDQLPARVPVLQDAVRDTHGFGSWSADFTPDSLEALGAWFMSQVEVRERTAREKEELSSSFSIEIPNEELTNRTFSVAMDIGMYFGEVLLHHVNGTSWNQPTQRPTVPEYGHMTVTGKTRAILNPVRIAVTLAYAFAAREQTGGRLRALYDYWSRALSPTH